jgi:tripartite-type tricarboxylate transporter receptor subunit TctC
MKLVRSIAAVALATIACGAHAQQYPARPVKIIVAFTPGSATDIVSRLLADSFTKSMGQTFVVENKPGAGGIIGTESAKNAAPDGYTLTACPSGPFGINPGIYSKLPYDPVKDFEPISNLVLTPQVIVVGSQTPYKTLKDLVDDAKKRPGEIAFGSLGTGSTSHLTMEAFQRQAGIKLNHIPFKGGAEAQSQIIGGSFPVMSDTITGVLTQVNAGKLRPLGVAIPKRSPYLPDAPTIAEQGYKGFRERGLDRAVRAREDAGRDPRQAQCRGEEIPRFAGGEAEDRAAGRDAGGRFARALRRLDQVRDREVVQGGQGKRRESRLTRVRRGGRRSRRDGQRRGLGRRRSAARA